MNAEYYGQRATAALTITEGSHRAPEGQGDLDIAGMYTEGHEEGWRLVAERVHEGGGRLWSRSCIAAGLPIPGSRTVGRPWLRRR